MPLHACSGGHEDANDCGWGGRGVSRTPGSEGRTERAQTVCQPSTADASSGFRNSSSSVISFILASKLHAWDGRATATTRSNRGASWSWPTTP
eukprot:7063475-Prymnesium_polylepis.1